MMRIAVTGRHGQIASALTAAARPGAFEVIAVGRPELDLLEPASILPALAGARADIIVSAAAYTEVDRAESEVELATRLNSDAAEVVASAARRLGLPLVHLSTDYVFDGAKGAPYRESDTPRPLGIYGATKLAGEARVAEATDDHVILRIGWVHGPIGRNFVRTMLDLAQRRAEIGVVADQVGTPTSAGHIAEAIMSISARLVGDRSRDLRGVFHLPSGGAASWADLAEETMRHARAYGLPAAVIRRITTADYPTPARRPPDSRLDGTRIAEAYGIRLPDWRDGLERTMAAIAAQGTGQDMTSAGRAT